MNLIFCQGPLFYSSCHGGAGGRRSTPEKDSDSPPRKKGKTERERYFQRDGREVTNNTRHNKITIMVFSGRPQMKKRVF